LEKISPRGAVEDDGEIKMTLKGRDFFPVSSVCFSGCRVPTTFVSQSELSATIPSHLIRTGTMSVFVINPKPHEFPDIGGTSNSVPFIVKFARLARTS
jgi:hypothetical protein